MTTTTKPDPPHAPSDDRGEIVIGLVKAMGTDLDIAISTLTKQLELYGWEPRVIRLFDESWELRRTSYELFGPTNESFIEYPSSYWRDHRHGMERGAWARAFTRQFDTLARDAMAGIQRERDPSRNQVFILRSLMHDHEVNLLRDVYGKRFFTIAAYEPYPRRLGSLIKTLQMREPGIADQDARNAAADLMWSEAHSPRQSINIAKTFQRADVFLDSNRTEATRKAIERFTAYLFSYPFGTPTVDEYGMSIAWQARYASDALSRSVGAAALDPRTGRLLAATANGTPRPPMHGPWPDNDTSKDQPDNSSAKEDYREHLIGRDSSDRKRWEVFVDTIDRLKDVGLLDKDVDPQKLYASEPAIRAMKQFDSISYGSTIHAEAHLIASAASSRTSLRGATLYVTTYPCHECTRLIIQSGVERVLFIEPYPKSLAADLYPRQIVERDQAKDAKAMHLKVRFEPFVGIAPTRFTDLFSFEPRKATDTAASDRQGLSGDRVAWPSNRHRVRPSILPALHLTRAAGAAVALLEKECIASSNRAWASALEEAGLIELSFNEDQSLTQ